MRELRQQIKWLGLVAAAGASCILISLASLVACNCDESGHRGGGVLPALFFIVLARRSRGDRPRAVQVPAVRPRSRREQGARVRDPRGAVHARVRRARDRRGHDRRRPGELVPDDRDRGRDRGRVPAGRASACGTSRTASCTASERRHTRSCPSSRTRSPTAFAAEDVLPRMAQILAERDRRELGPRVAAVRRGAPAGGVVARERFGPGPVAVEDGRPGGFGEGEDGVEVRHLGELLGALSVTMAAERSDEPVEGTARPRPRGAGRPGAPQRPADPGAPRASRRRIVTAQDERAKQLERNLHDGAQQQLVALGVQLSLARRLVERDAPGGGRDPRLARRRATDALENLRDLARGIYPPLLADQGLVAALDGAGAQGGRSRRGRGRGGRPLPAGGGGGRVLLLPRGAPERREVRERFERAPATR